MQTAAPPPQPHPLFEPRLDILPPAQQRLWPELSATPKAFTLHGGTAIALRLAHRASVDFDFFAADPFVPNDLLQSIPYLRNATVRQSAPNILTVSVERDGPIQVSFFGALDLGQVVAAERARGPEIKIASLVDLSGFKVAVVPQRVEVRDYIDVHTLLTKGEIPLATMLAAAKIIYGSQFNPLLAVKALAYLDDPALAELTSEVRQDLVAAIRATDIDHLPILPAMKKKPETA
jgi:hypothetical protein